ncbi:uncharacterized protein LOC128041905 [Gossypium raimondii]|uniref:uncharacterized protein LOC128041905 n=1 Tax=Gossypium raimondii TaxID=29730 RepID=UPI00227C560C|nr:uncharacterized protein LOC128041905 [Gossypium raimondii]XP_052488637.1 uncharacterized protein LOC128041905 [Gossypium raimondii]
MLTFPFFSKELSLKPKEDDEEGDEPTAEKQTIAYGGEAEKTKSVHVESEKKDDDVTQAPAPATTTTTLRATTPITAQERAVHQLINELTKSDSDSEDQLPLSQKKRKHFKTTAGEAVPAENGESELQQRYKCAAKKSTEPT